jgi:hypothetical protein
VIEIGRPIPLFQAPAVEHTDEIADGEGLFLVMGDQNRRGAALLENVAHLQAELLAQSHVEVGKRLVEQQQAWRGCQGAGQGHPLLLPARQLVGIAPVEAGQIHQFEHVRHYGCRVG